MKRITAVVILSTVCVASVRAGSAQAAAGGVVAEGRAASVQSDARLSEAQLRAIKSIQSASERKAGPLALRLAMTAKRIYENMLADRENQALRRRLSRELHEAAAALLSIKGQSVRDVIGVLTPEQKRLVRTEMRKPGAPGDLMEVIARTFNISDK